MTPVEATRSAASQPEPTQETQTPVTPEQKPERKPEPRQEKRDNRKGGRREDREQPVVGMGDHVPDFLMRGLKSEKA